MTDYRDGNDAEDFDDDGDESCTWCGGEPWAQDCDNPLECHCGGRGGHCSACNDTGLAKFQTVW